MKYFVIVLSLVALVLLVACEQPVNNTLEVGRSVATSSDGTQTLPGKVLQKTYQQFLGEILAFESSIDPRDAAQYKEQYFGNDMITSYPKVVSPGHVYRDDAGNYVNAPMNLRDYFTTIDVIEIYNPDNTNPLMFQAMQYSVINFLGFIGYQFSESDLQVLGYYNYAKDDQGYPIYYVDVPTSNWAHGVRDKVMAIKQPDGTTQNIHVTDVNRWGGTFTGKGGIYTLKDFKSGKSDAIAKDHFTFKYNNIVKLLAADQKTVKDFIGTTLYWDQLDPSLKPPKNVPNAVVVTYSGLLAGAHLRGAEGVYQLLVEHKNPQDEVGTAILQYVYQFGGYQTPFGP